MKPSEYIEHDGLALAALVKDKEVTPQELAEVACQLIDALNPSLNAIVVDQREGVPQMLQDGLPEGPFHGVPTLFKESLPIKGVPCTYASPLLSTNVPVDSTELAKRMLATGVVPLGRTNMSELGLLPFTESLMFGPAHNPWKLGVSTGGSSGGTAAAVAAGLVPFAHGADGGGSIRIPAAACGCFGLKPSRGRNPGELGASPNGYIIHHTLTRSVRDSAAMLDATRGPRKWERWHLPHPEIPYLDMLKEGCPPLRIAFSTKNFTGDKASDDCSQAIVEMAKRCEALGHTVEEIDAPVDGKLFNEGFRILWAQSVGYVIKTVQAGIAQQTKIPGFLRSMLQKRSMLQTFLRFYKIKGVPAFEPFSRRLAAIEAGYTPGDVWVGWNKMRAAEVQMAQFLDTYDLYLTPVLGTAPPPLGTFRQDWSDDVSEAFLLQYAGYTPFANASGFPAMSVPGQWNQEGLPIGCHFQAAMGREDLLFRLAKQLEEAHPWAHKWPTLTQDALEAH